MPLVLLSIPALAWQQSATPAAAYASSATIPVAITAIAEPPASRVEPARVTHARRGEMTIAVVPRLAPIAGELVERRRNGRAGRLARISWSLGIERLRRQSFASLPADKLTQHQAIVANAELGINFAGDRLCALANATLDKRPNGIVASNRNSASTRTLGAGIGWSHAGQWRLDIGVQSTTTTTQAKSPMVRLADLSDGSAGAERQVDAQLTLAPVALGPRAAATFGIRASAGQLTDSDRTLSATLNRRDNGVSLVARLAF